jgi:hypothetical protein
MSLRRHARAVAAALLVVGLPARAQSGRDVDRLVSALIADTPLEADLRSLTDEVGGRATGSPANQRAVEWALARFRSASVDARAEPFSMPARWQERSARATIGGEASFAVGVAAMPFSASTPASGLTAPLVDGGSGTEADFTRLGSAVRGAFVLVETAELRDLDGLFREYNEAAAIEKRAAPLRPAGIVYMASRPQGLLYRHNASAGYRNALPMMVVEREGALRALRLMRAGKRLQMTAHLDLETGGAYEVSNVIGEIRGTEKPDEVVLIGAHLDSWDLGTGALDNGCNVALVIDVARQIRALGLKPRRTMRFALWNGEEQGMVGSWRYTQSHAAEMDRHVMAASFDIGSGRISGFFFNGRPEIVETLEGALAPVRGLGPFTHAAEPVVGTDNYDFMMQGVANLVAIQEPASYGPNYHARSDTFDKVDLRQMRLNAAIAAAVAYGFAQAEVTWRRQTGAEVEALVEGTSLKQQMMDFAMWEDWTNGTRGRRK